MKTIAEAPAKVILTGEHFVVHGAWALACALPRAVRVEVEPADELQILSDRFSGHAPELNPVSVLVEAMAAEFSLPRGMNISITSEIPDGAGLGSSAATMVAVAAGVARFHSLDVNNLDIIRLSMLGEREVHGNPSGIDATACALGGAVLFRPGSKPKRVRVENRRSIVVSFSGKKRSTRRQIKRVAGVRDMFPSLFEGLTESASDVSFMAADRLVVGDMRGLGRLFNFNQAVLSSIGVSNRRIDTLVDLALSLGAFGAKLTGGGGGGSIVAVAPAGKEKSIISGLERRGFETFRAQIPVDGVRSWEER